MSAPVINKVKYREFALIGDNTFRFIHMAHNTIFSVIPIAPRTCLASTRYLYGHVHIIAFWPLRFGAVGGHVFVI